MEIETLTILKLNQQEAAALQKLLGQHSMESKLKLGLTRDECEITTAIFNELPINDEEGV